MDTNFRLFSLVIFMNLSCDEGWFICLYVFEYFHTSSVFSVNLQQFWPAVNQNSQPLTPNWWRHLSLSNQRSFCLCHHSPAVLAPYTLTCGPPPFPESAVQRRPLWDPDLSAALDNGWWKSGSIMANNLLHRGLLAVHSGRPRALCSAPAHADGCLLTLAADAKASAHEYNVILRPWGPGGLAGGQQSGPTRGRSPACVPSLRIYELNLLYVIHSIRTWAHLRMMKADWYNLKRHHLNYYIKIFFIFY